MILDTPNTHSIKRGAISGLFGLWLFQQSAELPDWPIIACIGGVLFASIVLRFPGWWHIGIAAWLWAAVHALSTVPATIDKLDTRADYQAIGTVVSLPETQNDRVRFLFRVTELQADEHRPSGDWLLRVTWYRATESTVRVGEQWRLNLRIKPVHGYRNPGGWDYAAWLYHQGIRYTAYVRSTDEARLIQRQDCCWLDRQRAYLRDLINATRISDSAKGIILALTIGDKSQLSRADKNNFALTGTSHLMAISGLHIGLAAGLFGGLMALLWRRIPYLCARYPAMLAGTWVGLITACAYALLSGFGLPAQRALIMLLVAAIALLQRKRCQPLDILALAAIVVGLYQPDAVLHAGFWLSFSAVAAILVLLPQIARRHWVTQAFALQLGISLALYPVLLIFGMTTHLLAPVINLILVPLFALIVVPVSLLGVALLPIFDWPAQALNLLAIGLDWLTDALQYVAQVDKLHLAGSGKPWWLWGILAGGVLLLLARINWRWRLAGILLFAFGQLPARTDIAPGDYQLTLLDVGQGLSAVIQTRRHTLIYDTGAAWPSGFNLADAVLLPYLRQQNIRHIDTLVISHGDNDHAGSAPHLQDKISIDRVLSGEPERLPVPAEPCQAGQSWVWDDVTFTILHPDAQQKPARPRKNNNQSCVLMISNRVGKTLLTGDIEQRTEYRLMPVLARHAPYAVVTAPHHGSNSSSSVDFIQTVQTDHVLFPVGAYNRYRFPHSRVLQRWKDNKAAIWRTDQSGAIEFQFNRQEGLLGPEQYRVDGKRYWHFALLKN